MMFVGAGGRVGVGGEMGGGWAGGGVVEARGENAHHPVCLPRRNSFLWLLMSRRAKTLG